MKAYILPSRLSIEPFGDPVADSMIGNRTLADHQRAVLGEAGLQPTFVDQPKEIQETRFLLTWDNVFFTRRVLESLLERFDILGKTLRCGLPADSLLVERTRPLQRLDEIQVDGQTLALYGLYLVELDAPVSDETDLRAQLRRAIPVRARFKEKVLEIPVPSNIMGVPHLDHPLTSSVVMHIEHWVHVLWANQLSIQIRWIETILDHKLWVGSKLLGVAAASLLAGRVRLPEWKWALAAGFNRIGRNCDIHPTARLEFCQLGDNVTVGANALVRGSLIADGVQIEERACVQYSVVGRDCFVSKNSVLVLCAGYPEGDLCNNGLQCSLMGRKVALTSWLRVIDVKARGEVQVMHRGRLESVGTNFLGVCFGHGAYGGMDATVQAGRSVPNGAMLVMNPDQIIGQIPEDLPPGQPAWARDGRAVTDRYKGRGRRRGRKPEPKNK